MTGAPPLLVVVADDAGVDVARNRGIVAGCAAGVIGAVSVLGTGPALDDLASRVRDLDAAHRPDIGLHLNLTEGHSLVGRIPGATDAAGCFADDKLAFWRAALAGGLDVDRVCAEVHAQIARLRRAGLAPTAIDGHQHVHVLPGVRDAVARVAREDADICRVRLGHPVTAFDALPSPFPRLPRARVAAAWRDLHDRGRVAQAALGTLHAECGLLLAAGLGSTDGFAGPDLVASPSRATLFAELTAAVESARCRAWRSIELMTHPGDCDEASVAFSGDPARRAERETLCDPDLPAQVAALGLRLGRFSDLDLCA